MPIDFVHHEHPRVQERKTEKPVKVRDQAQVGEGFFAKLNAKVGLKITLVVGTMWAAYAFALIALLSLPSTISSGSLFEIVVWISSSFLQLVLLPIIIVGQNIQARAADKRSEATYKDADAVLHEAREIQKHLKAQDAEIERILGLLTAQLNATGGEAS
jgi:hypothetical protein